MPNADTARILLAITLGGTILLVFRFFLSGLWRKYPVFFWYFVFRIPSTIWPLLIPNGRSYYYERLWILTEAISWIFHIGVVIELYRLVLKRHMGIYSLLRWAMYGSVLIAAVLTLLSLLPKIKPQTNFDTIL